jgi:predicted nucleic acid-binding Zn ribbon protein
MGDGGSVRGATHSCSWSSPQPPGDARSLTHAEATPERKVPPESVRTSVVGSPRRCPVCQAADLTGRQTVCSAACRGARTRQREQAARDARDREIQALLKTALKRLQEGVP